MSLPCFIDIETVPEIIPLQNDTWNQTLDLYSKKFRKAIESERLSGRSWTTEISVPEWEQMIIDHYFDNAALFSEFGKAICISLGGMANGQFIIKTAVGLHEQSFLQWIFKQLGNTENLCAHNGKEFDFPFLTRRMMIHRIPLPSGLNLYGKKTWDIKLEDTMEIWGGTAWKYKISLELLCYKLGIDSPKTEITGSDVSGIFYNTDWDVAEQAQAGANKIGQYCGGDTLAAARCYCAMKGLPDIKDSQVVRMPIQIIQNAPE